MSGIILYGDSVFFGYGASDRNLGCGRLLKKMLSVPVIIKARNNVTTKDALASLDISVLSYDNNIYSDVIILFGNNDSRLIGKDTPSIKIEEYRSNLKNIINKIVSAGRRCCIANLQPLNDQQFLQVASEIKKNMVNIKSPYEWHKQYSDVCGEVASSFSIPLIDIRAALEQSKENIFFTDGMHPNDLGHSIICNTMYKLIIKNSMIKK